MSVPVSRVLQLLSLEPAQLAEVRDALTDRIREGVTTRGAEIKCLPSYLPRPPADLSGEAIVLDAGGTNLRGALVTIGQAPSHVIERPMPRDPDTTAAALFEAHASIVKALGPRPGTPVGYCFSYPSESTADRDARLIAWTKGITIPGVEGTRVGAALRHALTQAGLSVGPVTVVNDTVACLLSATHALGEDAPETVIGLIAGTGTNMATWLRGPRWTGELAINLESGNFAPAYLGPWDDALDSASTNPGLQRFEKASSGYYLPFVFEQIVPDESGFDPVDGARSLVALAAGSGSAAGARVAQALLDRSADLIAAGLAGAARAVSDDGPVAITAEGSLFWRVPGYAARVRSGLNQLLAQNGPTGRIRRISVREGAGENLIGAAYAARTPVIT